MSLPTCSPTGAPRARPAPPVPGLAAFAALVPHRRLSGFTFHANLVSAYPNIFTKLVATDPDFDPDEADSSGIQRCVPCRGR